MRTALAFLALFVATVAVANTGPPTLASDEMIADFSISTLDSSITIAPTASASLMIIMSDTNICMFVPTQPMPIGIVATRGEGVLGLTADTAG